MYHVLIVDDEPVIRSGLVELIPWEELGLELAGAAENAEAALACLRAKPVDILITDIRMEGMSGLDLIEQTKTEFPTLRCVILSGYDDFAYTKQAIRLGIENYILKPVDEVELTETLLAITNKLDVNPLAPEWRASENEVLQSVLMRWLSGSIEPAALRHRAQVLQLTIDVSQVCAGVMRVLSQNARTDLRRIAQTLQDIWQPVENVWMRVCWDMRQDIALVLAGDVEAQWGKIQKQWEQLARHTAWCGGADVFFAFGPCTEDAMELSRSYARAREVAQLSLVLPAGSVVDEETARRIAQNTDRMPDVDFELLEKMIRGGETEKLTDFWNDWEKRVAHAEVAPKSMKNQAGDLLYRMAQFTATQTGSYSEEWNAQTMFEVLFAAQTTVQLKQLLLDFSLLLTQQFAKAQNGLNPSVRRVMDAVQEHYAEQLTLRGLAEQFRINPVYLGQLFKEQTGQLFTAYLNGVRLQYAQRFLRETNLPVSAIATRIGYLSQGYFCNLFKKHVGCYPREYRMQYGMYAAQGEKTEELS